ncbi:MAG: SNF2 helicase associated domain-containing protein [Calditrichaceae bacterium]|nr:SNF2 helicase associated domain-containing protein [Calditrichaceae bacterium]MBN2709984.1 SNF2 helicase associated domain-containing protein [Calditrichaceae bacterium]
MKIDIKELKNRVPDIIFRQGLEYFKEGRVQIKQWDNFSVLATVQGTYPYVVRLTADERSFDATCTCPYNYICKHAVAVALKLIEDQTSAEQAKTTDAANWREYFEKLIAIQQVDSDFSQEVRWKLVYIIHLLENYWNIKPVKVYMKKDGTYGRIQEPSFNELSEQNVFRTSGDLIAISYLERLQSQQSSVYYRGRLETSYLDFGLDAGQLFSLLNTSELHIKNEDGSIGTRIRYGRKEWRLIFKLKEEEENYIFQPFFVRDDVELEINKDTKILTVNPIWFYRDGKLHFSHFPLSYSYLKTFIDEDMKIVLSKNEYQSFISDYLAKLPIFPFVEFPPGIKVHEINSITGQRLYIEEMDDQLVVSLSIMYENIEISYSQVNDQYLQWDTETRQIIRVHRDRAEENHIREAVIDSGIVEDTPGLFYATFEDALDWLFDGLPALAAAGFEVLGEESLVRFKVNRARASFGVNISSETDWFDIELNLEFEGVPVTLEELKKALKANKKFVKLRDGSLARLPEKLIEKFNYLINFGKMEDGNIRFANHHLSFIDRMLAEADHKELDTLSKDKLKKLDKFDKIKSYKLTEKFRGELRDYQKSGYDWLNFLQDFSFGGILADDMGLGKTIQALALIQKEIALKPKKHNLIVAPTSVIFNWMREIEKFTPDVEYLIHYGTRRSKDLRRLKKFPLIITTYGHLRRDIVFLKEISFNYAILDESQNIKNPFSETSKAVRLLNAQNRLALTGTPVENNTMDLWAQFAFINPGLLGDQNFFKESFMRPIEKEQNVQVAASLKRLIFPFILRRTKEDVAKELPPKVENVLYSPMNEKQEELYEQWKLSYRDSIFEEIESKGFNKSKFKVLEGLIKLRQIACHPRLVDPEFKETSGKFDALLEMVEEIISEKHKVLIFSQFVQMLQIVKKFFDGNNIQYSYLDGSTKDRAAAVDKFQDNEKTRVFLISLKAGGTGLNLTAADYVIHYDPWWNPAVEMQATDRAYRIGQTKKVFAYKLISKDTVEEKILKLQNRKKDLVNSLITTEEAFFKSLSKEDILELFE